MREKETPRGWVIGTEGLIIELFRLTEKIVGTEEKREGEREGVKNIYQLDSKYSTCVFLCKKISY